MNALQSVAPRILLSIALAGSAPPLLADSCVDPLLREMARTDGNPDGEQALCAAPAPRTFVAAALPAYACDDVLIRNLARTDGNVGGDFGACRATAIRPEVARAGELAATSPAAR